MQYDDQPASVNQVSQHHAGAQKYTSREAHVVHACCVRTVVSAFAKGRRMVIICSKDKGDKA